MPGRLPVMSKSQIKLNLSYNQIFKFRYSESFALENPQHPDFAKNNVTIIQKADNVCSL